MHYFVVYVLLNMCLWAGVVGRLLATFLISILIADIEVANRHGHTCLMIACYKGHFKIAKYLIDIGADVNRKSVKGNTALHDCAESGSLDIMRLLITSGARIDVDAYGMTPLLAASVTGNKFGSWDKQLILIN